eukprot:scaffold36483_cov64-Phaeocystis_antarctica.AAC.3
MKDMVAADQNQSAATAPIDHSSNTMPPALCTQCAVALSVEDGSIEVNHWNHRPSVRGPIPYHMSRPTSDTRIRSNRPSRPAWRLPLQCAGHCKRPGRGLGRCADGHRGTDRVQFGAASTQGVRCDAAPTAVAHPSNNGPRPKLTEAPL